MRLLPLAKQLLDQWRNSYLLLAALFWLLSRVATPAISTLDGIRVGGLHPVDVLALRDCLQLIWGPLWGSVAMFGLSFRIRLLNSPEAVAFISLCSCVFLGFLLFLACMEVAFSVLH